MGTRTMIVAIDEGGRVVYVSPSSTGLLGYEAEEIIDRQNFDWIHQNEDCALLESYRKLRVPARLENIGCRIRHKSGNWVWLDSLVSRRQNADGSEYVIALTWDAVIAGEQDVNLRHGQLAKNASDVIIEVDEEGCIHFLSPNCISILSEQERCSPRRRLRTSPPASREARRVLR
jgi:PAS domain S-box-containing protein